MDLQMELEMGWRAGKGNREQYSTEPQNTAASTQPELSPQFIMIVAVRVLQVTEAREFADACGPPPEPNPSDAL